MNTKPEGQDQAIEDQSEHKKCPKPVCIDVIRGLLLLTREERLPMHDTQIHKHIEFIDTSV